LRTYITHAFGAYRELIRTGELKSSAEGEKVLITIQGSISGDILIFISPKSASAITEGTTELIIADRGLAQQSRVALQIFRQKFNGLAFLPKSLVWIANITFSSVFINRFYIQIIEAFAQNNIKAGIWYSLPVALLMATSAFFAKDIGFMLMRPFIKVMIFLFKLIHRK
jgi:hypothetical protein